MLEKLNPRNTLFKIITLRDILLLAGLSLLGYGLFIKEPWISLSVCGSLIILGGLSMQEK